MARTGKKEKVLTPEEKLERAIVPEAKQPYCVPANWCWLYGKAFLLPMETKKPTGDYFRYIDIDSIDNRQQMVSEPKLVKVSNAPSRASRALHTGDTVFSMVRPYLKNIAYIDESISDSIASTGFYICTPKENVNPKYNYYMMISPYVVDGLNSFMRGDNSPSIRKEELEHFPYPVPPLAEQQRIVDRIESLFTKLDEAKEKAQAVVDGFENRKAAILYKAFSGELTTEWRNTHGMTLDGWENAPLEKVFQLRSGSTIDVSEEKEYGAIPYVKVADMNLPENEIQITTSSRFVDDCPESHVIPKGSTIFPKRGGAILTNKKRYVGVEKIIADLNTMAIMPIAGIIYGWYGYYWMQSVDLRQLNNGSNVPQINNKDMVKLFVPTPPIEEQKVIVDILDSVFEKENEAKDVAEAVIDQIDVMKKSILARAFRGELGTNDPADESAEELLKRIL